MKKLQVVVLVPFVLAPFSMFASTYVKGETTTFLTDKQDHPNQSVVTMYGALFNSNAAVNLTVTGPTRIDEFLDSTKGEA